MKRKQERFRIIEGRDNVVEPTKAIYTEIRGKWNELYFKNDHPITVELACGRGEYTVGLARRFPNRNFIGVDVKGERIWKGSTQAFEENLANVAFLRANILVIENFFSPGEIDELWLTFPDPRPRKRDAKRRLTSARYLDIYQRLMRPGGFVRLKTDNTILYEFTRELVEARADLLDIAFTDDLYASHLRSECFDIKTRYEDQFTAEGERIKYLRFRFP